MSGSFLSFPYSYLNVLISKPGTPAVLPPNSLCSRYSFQGRGSRIDFHRNVRRGAGNFPVSYTVFTTRIRVNPAAIHVVPVAKNRICLVKHKLLSGTPDSTYLKQVACGQCSADSRTDLSRAEVNVESRPGAFGLVRRGPIREGDFDCRNARLVGGTRTVRRSSRLAPGMVAVVWFCHGTHFRGGLDHLDAFNLDR